MGYRKQKKELQKRIKTLQIFLLYYRNAKYNITMRPTIIDTKELHYNSYYKYLQRFRGQEDSQDYIHHKITMIPTIIENRKLLSSSYLVCSSTCTKQSFRGHIHMNHTKGEQSNVASILINNLKRVDEW